MWIKYKDGIICFVTDLGGVARLLNTNTIMDWVLEIGYLISVETCISVHFVFFSIYPPLPPKKSV